MGVLPVRNHMDQVDPLADRLGDLAQHKHLFLGKAACFGCPIRCSQMGVIRTGTYAHQVTDIVEYESAALMGANLGIHDVRAVAHLVKLCDTYGIDSMSAAGVIGFAFEAALNGVIQAPAGVVLDFGSVAGAEYLLHAMVRQDDALGRLLGRGQARQRNPRSTAKNCRPGNGQHVKGLESPATETARHPRHGAGLHDRRPGRLHQRGFMIAYEVGGRKYRGRPVTAIRWKARRRCSRASRTTWPAPTPWSSAISAPSPCRPRCAPACSRPPPAGMRAPISSMCSVSASGTRRGCSTCARGCAPRTTGTPPRGRRTAARRSAQGAAHQRGGHGPPRIRGRHIRGWDRQGRPTPQTLARLGLDAVPTFELPNSEKE